MGLALYLTAAVFLSIRGFLRATSPLPTSMHEQIGQWMRTSLASFEPVLLRLGVHPTLLTLMQLGMSLLAGVAYAIGCIFIGGWLMLGCGVLDLLDGGLARRTAQASRRGAFLDSVIDRYAEFFTFCGLGVFFSSSWMLWVVAFGFLGSMMVSYTRARAEGLGVECRGGLMQRGERYVLLGVSSFLSTALNHLFCRSTHEVLIAGLVLLAVLTNLTALSRVRVVATALREQ
ncbi:MAG TPA: CDP-alcohol phosphatidyltransferase family protein [Candidatus Binatia bacterium]|nr:CDP-alcohol phosphatidyltransferase family protein [Candidatus Binatia bacterium]